MIKYDYSEFLNKIQDEGCSIVSQHNNFLEVYGCIRYRFSNNVLMYLYHEYGWKGMVLVYEDDVYEFNFEEMESKFDEIVKILKNEKI